MTWSNGTQIIILGQSQRNPKLTVEELREICKQYFYFSQHCASNYQISSETHIKELIMTSLGERKKWPVQKQKVIEKAGYKESIKNVLGIKNFAPVRCDGEDDESIAEYMPLMENQVKLLVNLRNKSFVTKAMDKTFSERRKFLLEKIRKIEDVKIQYPVILLWQGIFNLIIWNCEYKYCK